LKKAAKSPPAEPDMTFTIITLAGALFLGLKIAALPPLKKSQQTHNKRVPRTIKAGFAGLKSGF
jgi:hypothetical protein